MRLGSQPRSEAWKSETIDVWTEDNLTILRIILPTAIWSLSKADLDVDLGFHADEHHVTVL